MFAVVDGDVGFTACAVGGGLGARHMGQNIGQSGLQQGEMGLARGVVVAVPAAHLTHRGALQRHSAIFSNDAQQGPGGQVAIARQPRQAPADRTACDGNHWHACRMQGLQGLQRFGHQAPVTGQCVVNVGDDTTYARTLGGRPVFEWPWQGLW